METIKYLSAADQQLVLIYLGSGVSFLVFTYLIAYCNFIINAIRASISILMFSIGFMFMSTAGNIINGHEYSLKTLTQGSIIICTIIALWVVREMIKWNGKKQKEQDETNLPNPNKD